MKEKAIQDRTHHKINYFKSFLGQHSVRINRQWRICFEWHDGDAYNVEITDYH
jgi:proteic killer suppression protein